MNVVAKAKDHWAALTFIGAVLIAGGIGALRADELMRQVAANTNWIAQQNYFRLDELRAKKGLTYGQWQQWCAFAKKAGAMQSCPRFIPDARTGRAK